jgi:SAM-dependent methyltransferase
MAINNYLAMFVSAIKRRGIIMTCRIAWHELAFDWKYGTETRKYIETASIQTESFHKGEGHKYGPLQVPFFQRVFVPNGPISSRTCYIDFGCGKGRALILAALSGFLEIIGIEYSKAICAICKDNIEKFRSRTGSLAKFEIIHCDAVDYSIPDNASVMVFYDPFELSIFEKVVSNIANSLRRAPRDVYIVYFNYSEKHKSVLNDFEKVIEYPTDRTIVYRAYKAKKI